MFSLRTGFQMFDYTFAARRRHALHLKFEAIGRDIRKLNRNGEES